MKWCNDSFLKCYSKNGSGVPPYFETLIENFEVENETLKWNFETPVWNS